MYTKYRIFMNIRIASSIATLSSRDTYLWKEVKKIPTENVLDSEIDTVGKLKIYHMNDDLTIQKFIEIERAQGNNIDDAHKHPNFIDLVEKYKADGWMDVPADVQAAVEAMWKRREAKVNQIRQKKGYVLCKPFNDLTPEDHHGGFSPDLLNEEVLKKYISNNTVFGFIGSSARKHILDKYLEHFFMKLKPRFEMTDEQKRNLLAVWLTSSDGRHFGDTLESLSSKGIGEQKKYIKFYLKSIFNTAFVYTLQEHKGTYKSTCELLEKHQDKLFELSDTV